MIYDEKKFGKEVSSSFQEVHESWEVVEGDSGDAPKNSIVTEKTSFRQSRGEKTREAVLQAAIRLFAENGVKGTPIRRIAREAGINEASLYNHFSGKADLFDVVVQQFRKELETADVEEEDFSSIDTSLPLYCIILDDARKYIKRARTEFSRQIWRVLMMEQYTSEAAAEFIDRELLQLPEKHFRILLKKLKELGKVRAGLDVPSAAGILASVFFYYGFAANLRYASKKPTKPTVEQLEEHVRTMSSMFQ
ncbi:MAG: TetR/AcrR family transcriptional regulator [Spirochaetia bacterium]|nr:TetR/AcrR family transcriptional regulator [Spirochaetia bacterium]